MASDRLRLAICLCILLFNSHLTCGQNGGNESRVETEASTEQSVSRPLVKRPTGTTYTTILAADGGGTHALVSAMVLIEVEQSIKEYLLDNPQYLPDDGEYVITSTEDFDINLADYFDCMTGAAAGSWTTMYLASRGGQGTFQDFLDRPDIVQTYGVVQIGSAAGLRVFLREFMGEVYPQSDLLLHPVPLEDLFDPQVPGLTAPTYPSEGMISSLETVFGDTTLADLDTSVIVYCFDLADSVVTPFMQNRFRTTPVTSYFKMFPRIGPKEPASADPSVFAPDLQFYEGNNFYLSEVGAASFSVPVFHAAQVATEVYDENLEFLMIDGNLAVEAVELVTSYIVETESGSTGFDNIAVLSVGTGHAVSDLVPLANAGSEDWTNPLISLYYTSGKQAQVSLLDYIFYSDPDTEPYQYLRVQVAAQPNTEEGEALSVIDDISYADVYEQMGTETAEIYKRAIDSFVSQFIFG